MYIKYFLFHNFFFEFWRNYCLNEPRFTEKRELNDLKLNLTLKPLQKVLRIVHN